MTLRSSLCLTLRLTPSRAVGVWPGLWLMLAVLPAAAQELATTVRSIEVVPGIYMLDGVDGFSSNMGLLVGDDHVLLIDDGMAPITDRLMAKVQELAGRPADFLVTQTGSGTPPAVFVLRAQVRQGPWLVRRGPMSCGRAHSAG